MTAGISAARLRWYMVGTYVLASVAAVIVTFSLVGLGFEFTLRQWVLFLVIASFVIPCYTLPDIYMISRHIRPITTVLAVLDRGGRPASPDVSRAIVRALNLPFFSFMRVTLFHGPVAAVGAGLGLYVANHVADGGFAPWQIVGLSLTIFLFASPAHAISEFFVIAKKVIPEVERMWRYCDRVEEDDQRRIISIRLRSKLLYLSIFVNSLPLLFFAGSIVFKVDRLLVGLGLEARMDQMLPILQWAVGVVLVCMVGTLAMSVFVASEVSRSAARLIEAMGAVEGGQLDSDLHLTSTDEYAAVYRGFNLMLSSLREEVRILQLSHDLAGELNLDLLLSRLVHATTELLNADRSTLFLYDKKTNELFSRVAEGLEIREIRIPTDTGIAGAVFTRRQTANIADPYNDPRFNKEVDRRTGYRTDSILAMPIVNKAGQCIGVTQVLNKRGGHFTARDEARLGAFTAQIAIALENAKLHAQLIDQQRIRTELALAQQIQKNLLPKPPERWHRYRIAAAAEPCFEVGGDFYDFLAISPTTMGVVIADVSGKGISSALVMSTMQATLRALMVGVHSFERLLEKMNDVMREYTGGRMFITLFLALFDSESNRVHYINAGHNPPVVVCADGRVEQLCAGGTVLGLLPHVSYVRSQTELQPGDVLVLYTDGVTEASNADDDMLGIEGVVDAVRAEQDGGAPDPVIQRVMQAVRDFSAGQPKGDDQTIVVVSPDR